MTHRFHDGAFDEYLAAIRFYTRANRVVGERFMRAIENAIAEIITAPDRWRLVGHGVRRRVIQRFPYAIYYRMHETHVFLLAVAHTSRRPGYWRERIG